MTAAEITQAYGKAKGWKLLDYDGTIMFLLPYVMMDVAYEYYTRDIKPVVCQHKCKVAQKRIVEGYTKFNRGIFDCLDADTTEALCDKMDSFKSYMYTDIIALQAKMMRCFPPTLPASEKQVVSAALLINRIARIAQDIWGNFYVIGGGRIHTQNEGLNRVLGASREFAKEFCKAKPAWVDYSEEYEAKFVELMKGLDAFKAKCIEFVKYDKKTE